MSVTIKNNINKIIDAKDMAVQRALEMIGIKAEKYAKALCPVDTGNLRNSISHDHDDDSMYVGTNVEYAPYQELGTRLMKATNGGKGYLRPALQDHLDEYKKIAEDQLKGLL